MATFAAGRQKPVSIEAMLIEDPMTPPKSPGPVPALSNVEAIGVREELVDLLSSSLSVMLFNGFASRSASAFGYLKQKLFSARCA
ncbi:MAG: hypothetical protein R3C24_00460 [Cyanobacteriota/Melainabacteria group bacterium]